MGLGRQSLELEVIELIKGASKSREVWETECPHLSPLDEGHRTLLNWASTVERHGLLLAWLAIDPRTRAELETEMSDIVDRAPAWLDAHLQGQETMTLELFLQGLAQTLARQRVAIKRVVAEQVVDSEPIEETLAEAPVPRGTPDEERRVLMRGVGQAMTAHMKALVDLAYDLEGQAGLRPDHGG